ncbi:2-succinyl-5-enolpyruvyl-6-hydroxy-3-cyclohexene-1-carboxylic-acid synthase [Anditalea andensis]|uniref:2-succinyl-5-enolpyruvyl-6-hydroxy-3- cyclohexene-1-carboxylic-acid synthase n=1 Tax=Anditalea andensis TaxID=1048983 RepID=UPI000B230A4F|nr:2-succinyl-5-enolpyruvyl-6-hydroxy-3-cyclohexene-1-carboxylic-acid synthase [Anditalea andensis]
MAIVAKSGIHQAILSPGSRCAPLTLAFARHKDIHCRTISDERSAAFIALGMAQQLDKAVVLVCTSGSAALNYAPAVAEAYFQQVPLLIITADRPKEWIDQWDGQTIRQENIYGNHVKGSFNFPDEFSHPDKVWHAHRISNEAIKLAQTYPYGPVHINIPLREPFYPTKEEQYDYEQPHILYSEITGITVLTEDDKIKLKHALSSFKKILIVPGQHKPDDLLKSLLDQAIDGDQGVLVADGISNMSSINSITYHDHFLPYHASHETYKPDLIISFGKSIISKSLKRFLRNSGAEHWHIQENGYLPDTYQSLAIHIKTHPIDFFNFFIKNATAIDVNFKDSWTLADQKVADNIGEILKQVDFGEYKSFYKILPHLPSSSKLHLSNSMGVRYYNFLGAKSPTYEVICNRGTSGIDGSNSTAVGCAFTTKDPITLITGDMAFFYDRNAFWHNYSMPNLRIIIMNNHAGGIFRLIEGPSDQPELEEFFETRQALDAEHLCRELGFKYFRAENEQTLDEVMKIFFHKSVHPQILEVFSDSKANAEIFQRVKSDIKNLLTDSSQNYSL